MAQWVNEPENAITRPPVRYETGGRKKADLRSAHGNCLGEMGLSCVCVCVRVSLGNDVLFCLRIRFGLSLVGFGD